MALCGPKMSIFCMVLSVWGVIMLLLLGIFLRMKSPAFAEDLAIDDAAWAKRGYDIKYVHDLYDQASSNCFIAAGLYVGVFAFSFIQHRLNLRANYVMS